LKKTKNEQYQTNDNKTKQIGLTYRITNRLIKKVNKNVCHKTCDSTHMPDWVKCLLGIKQCTATTTFGYE